MKRTLLTIMMASALALVISAQQGSPPSPPNHGMNGNQGGGGNAPLGSGLVFFLTMGTAYGARKVYKKFKSDKEVNE